MDDLGQIDLVLPDTSLGVSLYAALNSNRQKQRILQVDESGKYGSEEGYCFTENDCIIDKWPVVFYARGPLAQLLLDLSLTDYLEFCAVSRCSLWLERRCLVAVPMSKEQVMLEPLLTLPEKRRLFSVMKALMSVGEDMNGDGLLVEYLQGRGLGSDDRVFQLLMYAALQCPGTTAASEMTISTAKATLTCHRQSVEHLQTGSPFVFALWGMGSELVQAASRRAALQGVIHILRPDLIGEARKVGESEINKIATGRVLYRWTFLRNEALFPGSATEMFSIPPGCELNGSDYSINILQLTPSTRFCPPGKVLLVVWSLADLKAILDDVVDGQLLDYSQCREHSYEANGFTNFPLIPANYSSEREFISNLINIQ